MKLAHGSKGCLGKGEPKKNAIDVRKTPDLGVNTEILGLRETHGRDILFWLRTEKGPSRVLVGSNPERRAGAPCKLWANLENPTRSHAWYIDYPPCSQCLSGDYWL